MTETAGARAHILVVEDTPMNLELVRDLLERAGYMVLSATSAEEGLDLARRERPALILMDVNLPGMDGLSAARALTSDPATRGIPVAALTSYAMRGDDQLAHAAGCVAYFTKPIDTRTFVARVAALLATHGGTPAGRP